MLYPGKPLIEMPNTLLLCPPLGLKLTKQREARTWLARGFVSFRLTFPETRFQATVERQSDYYPGTKTFPNFFHAVAYVVGRSAASVPSSARFTTLYTRGAHAPENRHASGAGLRSAVVRTSCCSGGAVFVPDGRRSFARPLHGCGSMATRNPLGNRVFSLNRQVAGWRGNWKSSGPALSP